VSELRQIAVIVEDEWLVRMEIADALEAENWEVKEFATGEDAVAWLASAPASVDLLVSDIRLAGPLTGWSVARDYRAKYPKVGVIYVSANPNDPQKSVSGGVFLSKPCAMEKLVEVGRALTA